MSLFYLLFCLTLTVLNKYFRGGNKCQENRHTNYGIMASHPEFDHTQFSKIYAVARFAHDLIHHGVTNVNYWKIPIFIYKIFSKCASNL